MPKPRKHKRKGPKSARAGSLYGKPQKHQRAGRAAQRSPAEARAHESHLQQLAEEYDP